MVVSKMVLLRVIMDLMEFKMSRLHCKDDPYIRKLKCNTFLGGGYFAKVVIEVQI